MSCCSPRNVIVVKGERAPSPRSARACRSDVSTDLWHAPQAQFERVFTCLYRAGRGGFVREPEVITTPLPGKSSERPGQNAENRTSQCRGRGSNPITSTRSPVHWASGGIPVRHAPKKRTGRVFMCLYGLFWSPGGREHDGKRRRIDARRSCERGSGALRSVSTSSPGVCWRAPGRSKRRFVTSGAPRYWSCILNSNKEIPCRRF